MCSPMLLTIGASAMQAKAAIDEGKYQAGVDRYNARVAENRAQEIRNVGTEKELKQREATAQLLSHQRVQLGAANVALGSGSAQQLQHDTQLLGEADAMRIRHNTDINFQSSMQQSKLFQSQAAADEAAGRNKAIGSLLTGASAVATKWYTPNSAANTGTH